MITKDSRLTPIRARIRELQREIDDLEWMGLAPEKLSDKLNELQYLQQLELAGDTLVPNF
jgi:predicted RNase H-like nuclease (RuvC/YqgF family)